MPTRVPPRDNIKAATPINVVYYNARHTLYWHESLLVGNIKAATPINIVYYNASPTVCRHESLLVGNYKGSRAYQPRLLHHQAYCMPTRVPPHKQL